MITPNDVKLQLMAVLPTLTTEFGDAVTPVAAAVSGPIVAIVVANHGLETGDIIVGSEISINIPVTDVAFDSVAGEATITTAFEHDRTSGVDGKGGYNFADLQGFADSNYNGDEFLIKSATKTTIVIDATADAVGALGNMVEPRDLFLGFLSITRIDDNLFAIPLNDTAIPDGTTFNTFNYVSEQRIFLAADINRAYSAFGQRRGADPMLFVIPGQEAASKDRHTINDAIITANAQNALQLTYIPEYSLVEFAATKTELSAATKMQQIYEEIRPALRKAMYGHIFEEEDAAIQFAAHEITNGSLFFNKGYYIHQFNYAIPYVTTIEQGAIARRNVSFRNLIVNSTMFNTEGADVLFATEIVI